MLPSTVTRHSSFRRLALLLLVALWLVPASASSTKSAAATTAPRVVRQSAAIPLPPRCVTITQWTTNSMLIMWTDSPPSANVTHYQVGYGLVPTERVVEVSILYNAWIVDNLEPGKTYVVAVSACNSAGCSQYREKDITLSRDADGGARNSFNEQSQCTAVRAHGLLEVPMEVRCESLSSTTVRVSWTDEGVLLPIRLAGSTVYYTVRHTPSSSRGLFELRPSNSDDSQLSPGVGRRAGNELNASVPTVVYSNLRPAMAYEFAVRKVLMFNHLPLTGSQSQPVQAIKQSSWSMKVECHTLEATPGNAPTNLRATQASVDTVELTWQPCTLPNGKIVNYTALMCREPCANSESAWLTRLISMSDDYHGGSLVGNVGGLQPGASYRFRVREGNSVGDSPPSEPTGSIFLDSQFEPPEDDDIYDTEGPYDHSTVRNNDPEDPPIWLMPSVRPTTASKSKSKQKRPSGAPRLVTTTPVSRGSAAAAASPQQEMLLAIIGAVTGTVTIVVIIVLVVVCRRRRDAKLKRLRERSNKQLDGEQLACCSHSHANHLQAAAGGTHAHPHSTLSVSLHGTLPPDAAALLYPTSPPCSTKTPPATPHGALRRLTLSSSLGSPLSASSCMPLLNASNLPTSPYLTADGEPDDSRFDPTKFATDSLHYDPSASMSATPYRLTGNLTPSSSSALGGAPRCGSAGGFGVELRSLSSAAESTGSASNADGQRSSRGVPFVSPLHLPRTINLLNSLGAQPNERVSDLPALPPSQSLFTNVAHPHGVLMRERVPPFGVADLETCTTAGTGSNSMASLSSSGFMQRAARGAQHPVVDTTILSPLSKPRSLARANDEQTRQSSATRSGGAATPLSVSSSGSANNSGSACSGNVKPGRGPLSPTRSRVGIGSSTSARHGGGGILLSPVSGTTTIDPGYASSTSTSLAPGPGGAPSVDSGCMSNTSRSAGTTHRRDDFQSYKSFSTDELSAEIAHIEGIMKDLSSITQKDFKC